MTKEEIVTALHVWALTKPEVQRGYVFGSRARDDFQVDSDLDVAVELVDGLDECNGLAYWMFECDIYQSELDKLFSYTVDLEQLTPDTPTIISAIERSSYLAYDKDHHLR